MKSTTFDLNTISKLDFSEENSLAEELIFILVEQKSQGTSTETWRRI